MFRVRSDLGLSVPYGDPINLQIELDREFDKPKQNHPETGVETFEQQYILQAQIRNTYGHLLADFEFIYDDGWYYLFCDKIIPVGLHYMDIRVEVINTGDLNIFHTETIQIDVYGSVTHNYYEDRAGMDSRYNT